MPTEATPVVPMDQYAARFADENARLRDEIERLREVLQAQKATIVLLRSQVRMLGAEPIAEVTGQQSINEPTPTETDR